MKSYQVRYLSEMIGGNMALFGEYPTITEARKWANWLIASFIQHGFKREAKSVQVC